MKKRTIGIILAVVAIGVVIAVTTGSRKKEEDTGVQLTAAKTMQIVQKVNATGKIQPKVQVKISADVSARITKLAVKEGDFVKKGQFLLELDRERSQASVESQEANVRAAQSNAQLSKENMEQAERVLNRSREMFAKKLESQAELDRAQANYQIEKARYQAALDQVEQSRGLLKQSKDGLDKTVIYAPMSGTVAALKKELGEIAIGSQFQEDVIMTIADLNEMEAKVNVDENDIVDIKLDQDSDIEVDALLGEVVKGKVSEIASSANQPKQGEPVSQKTEFEVKIAVTSNAEKLRPGMTASADIVTHTRDNTLAVPIQSVTVRTLEQLTNDGEKKDHKFVADKDGYVQLVFVAKDGVVSARQVKTGIQSDDYIEIKEGLSEGEQVVSGSYRAISRDLKDGDKYFIEDEKTAKGKKGGDDAAEHSDDE